MLLLALTPTLMAAPQNLRLEVGTWLNRDTMTFAMDHDETLNGLINQTGLRSLTTSPDSLATKSRIDL